MFIQALLVCVLPALVGGQERAVLPRGHAFFTTGFEGGEALKGWSGPGMLGDGFQGGHALVLERTAEQGPGYATATITLPVEQMRGYVVQFSARIKAHNVSRKPQPYNGVKFMAPVVTDQEKIWPAAELGVGTFDWQKIAFRAIIPEDARQVTLVVGLEAVTGKAWFDDIRVIAWKPLAATGSQEMVGSAYKGHDLPRLRGAMVSPNIDAEGLRVLGQQWNANLVRWQLVRTENFADPLDLVAYDRWLQSALKQLDAALPLCEKYSLRVVVDLHSPPGGHRLSGGYAGSDHGLFTDAACQRKLVEVWQHMAIRYKDSKAIWGYDLANEPVEAATSEDMADWQDLAERVAKAIRVIDPQRTIIVEPPEWGNPQGLRELRPLAVSNVVYSVHMYLPHAFTHQGVGGPGKTYRYPGAIEGRQWDKAQLEAALKPVVDFQRKYNVHIYIGEFSAIRWASDDSAYRYLKDLIDIFELHGWDWSYHAFREWDGWSVEHGPDPKDHGRAKSPTDREQLLRSWFAQNLKCTEKSATVPPQGFVSLFNGTDLDGWTVRQADNHDWTIVDGVIDCNPHGESKGDQNLWTKTEYGDFELLVDWRIKESPYVNRNARIILSDGNYKRDASGKEITITVPNTDSGVFLRGEHKSQANIWCWPVGSGEVWGYRTDPKFSAEVHAGATPKVKADRPIGQWNTFHIVMQSDRLTVNLNGKLVIDNARLPGIPAKGPIALQHHADRKDGEWGASLVQFRNIYIKKLATLPLTPPVQDK